jgi:hypothetical protein
MRAHAVGVAVVALATTGCGSQIGFGRARTLEPGHGEVSGSVEIDTVSVPTDQAQVPLPWVQVGAGYRHGIVKNFDLGARGWAMGVPGHFSAGLSLESKLQFVRSRDADAVTGLVLGYQHVELGGTPWHVFGVGVPVLMGINFKQHQFVIGPRAGYLFWTGYGMDTIAVPFFGGSTGVSIEVAKRTRLMPEVVITYIPISFNGEVDQDRRYGSYQVQLGLSLSYDL